MKLEDVIHQKKFRNEHQKALINLLYTGYWLNSRIKDFLKKHDISPQQYNILRILRGQYPNPSSVNLLRERMMDKMSDASRLVERLRQKGLIVRKVSETDRRIVDISISPRGLDLLTALDPLAVSHEETLIALSDSEAALLNDLLDKLRGQD